MLIPFVLFWLLIFLGREELGLRRGLIAVAIWAVLLIGFLALAFLERPISPFFFVVPIALMDIVLILMIFGGDIKIR
jgi:hypothetical protein